MNIVEDYFEHEMFDLELMSLESYTDYFDFILSLIKIEKNESLRKLSNFFNDKLQKNLLYAINYFQSHRDEPLLGIYIRTCFPDNIYEDFIGVVYDGIDEKRESIADSLVNKYINDRWEETKESRINKNEIGFDPNFDPAMEIYDYVIPRSGFNFILSYNIRNDLSNLREKDSESIRKIAKNINDFYNRFETNTELRNWLIYILVNKLKSIVGVRGSFRIIPKIMRKRFYLEYKDTSIARIYYKKQKEYKNKFNSDSNLIKELNLSYELNTIDNYYPNELREKILKFKGNRRKK